MEIRGGDFISYKKASDMISRIASFGRRPKLLKVIDNGHFWWSAGTNKYRTIVSIPDIRSFDKIKIFCNDDSFTKFKPINIPYTFEYQHYTVPSNGVFTINAPLGVFTIKGEDLLYENNILTLEINATSMLEAQVYQYATIYYIPMMEYNTNLVLPSDGSEIISDNISYLYSLFQTRSMGRAIDIESSDIMLLGQIIPIAGITAKDIPHKSIIVVNEKFDYDFYYIRCNKQFVFDKPLSGVIHSRLMTEASYYSFIPTEFSGRNAGGSLEDIGFFRGQGADMTKYVSIVPLITGIDAYCFCELQRCLDLIDKIDMKEMYKRTFQMPNTGFVIQSIEAPIEYRDTEKIKYQSGQRVSIFNDSDLGEIIIYGTTRRT